MLSLLVELLLVGVALWALTYISRFLLVGSPLRDVPGPKRTSFIFGHLREFFARLGPPWHLQMVERYGRVFKFSGLCGTETLYVADPKALQYILVRDLYTYEPPAHTIEANKVIVGDGLFSTKGDHHRRQRKLLGPAFSIANIKALTPIFYRVASQLIQSLSNHLKSGPQEVDMLTWMSQLSLECIAQGGMGHSFNAFTSEGVDEFPLALKHLSTCISILSIPRIFTPFLIKLGPPWFRRFLWFMIPWSVTHTLGTAVDIMHNTALRLFESKKRTLQDGCENMADQAGSGTAIIDVLMKANVMADETERLAENEIIGQLNTLILAARVTTSTVLSRILDILSRHPDKQAKLRQEIVEARASIPIGHLNYDELMGLPYLDAVVKETLRLYPPVGTVHRVTRTAALLPLSQPLPGVREANELFVPKNTTVTIGIAAVNRDPLIWGGDAAEWKPERWIGKRTEEVSPGAKLPSVYSGIMTFIGGGRSCLGFSFAVLETKIVLSALLSAFTFEPTDEILWENKTVSTPIPKGKVNGSPSMPMRVKTIDGWKGAT